MKDLLGYEICKRIEKTSMEKIKKVFNPVDCSIKWDDCLPLLFSAFITFYAINVLKVNGRKSLTIHVFSLGEKMSLLAKSKEEDIYRNIGGERDRFAGATINEDDDVMIIYTNDMQSRSLVEYRPLLTVAATYGVDSLRYIMEKQFAFDYLNKILVSCQND